MIKARMTNILFTGDFCPINRIAGLVDTSNYADIFCDFFPIFVFSAISSQYEISSS